MATDTTIDLRTAIQELMTRYRWSKDSMAHHMGVSYITLNAWLQGGGSVKCETNARVLLSGGTVGREKPAAPPATIAPNGTGTAIPAEFRKVIPNVRTTAGLEIAIRRGYLVFSDDALAAIGKPACIGVHVNDATRGVLFLAAAGSGDGFVLRGHGQNAAKREISGGNAHAWMLDHGYELQGRYLPRRAYGGLLITPEDKKA